MSNRKEKKNLQSGEDQSEKKPQLSDPWISMRTGLILIAIVSIAMVVLVILTGNPEMPILERALYGLGFGASIWVVAVVFFVFNRFILRR